MTEIEIIDLWMEMFGSDCPKGFLAAVAEYRKRRGFNGPTAFTLADFTICTMLWDIGQKMNAQGEQMTALAKVSVEQEEELRALKKELAALKEGKKNG